MNRELWKTRYRDALAEFLHAPDEEHRQVAYDIGRNLIASGASVLELHAAHTHALTDALETGPDDRSAQVAAQASEFLAEGLSPFEMALRGFRDTNQLLRDLNETLERRIEERTRERLELEQQVRAARRMEAVGRLAAGIAHDFNNVLTIIQSYAVFLEAEFEEGDEGIEMLRAITAASERAGGLTRQLLAFSRSQAQQLEVIDLNDAIRDLDRLLGRSLGSHIHLQTTLADDLHPVVADITQIEQVVLNLAVNARDAMPTGGHLTIETANVQVDSGYVSSEVEAPPLGDYVMVAVSDDGMGMTPETKARIFEPFFTTKPEGEGSGLGLATVYGIVRQHAGYVWVYSEPGEGTTFKIFLPPADASPREPDETHVPPVRTGGGETILLVEDSELVRRAASRLLRPHGYEIIECESAEAAEAVIERRLAEIDVLITDVVMPGKSGPALAEELRAIRPDLPVVFMSGYTGNAVRQRGLLGGDAQFVQKPFTPKSLLHAVLAALDARP